MTTLKFDRSVKYQGVRYAAHEVFNVEDADVEDLRKAGATVISVAPATPPEVDETEDTEQDQEQESGEDTAHLKEELLEYTVPELIKFAEERGIDLQKKTKKAEIYNIIVATLN